MRPEDFKYKITIDILTPQVDGTGMYVRYNEVTIFEQKVINLEITDVIAVVNGLPTFAERQRKNDLLLAKG